MVSYKFIECYLGVCVYVCECKKGYKMRYHYFLEPQKLKKACALLISLFCDLFTYSLHFDLFKFIKKYMYTHIFQGINALCMVHSLEGVYVCHVTSGCHGNFSLLLNWKIITLAKIPYNLSALKLKMPGGSPGSRILFLVGRDRKMGTGENPGRAQNALVDF